MNYGCWFDTDSQPTAKLRLLILLKLPKNITFNI